MSKTATLTFSDGTPSIELPVLEGTYGKPVIDIRVLAAHGYFTHDPGFTATSSCNSAITYIDGDEGLLYYRGYPIEELAYQSDHMEVCYLLLHGELPTAEQKTAFVDSIRHHTLLHDQMENVFRGFRRSAHPMAVMIGVTGAMSAFYHEGTDLFDPRDREIVAHRLIAKIPTVAAWAYKFNEGQPFVYPDNRLSYSENFMHMMFSTPCGPYEPNPVLARALDRIFLLHADHEQNASTSTVRLAGSSGANPYACVAAGMASLWGPLHGGANEAVLKMLDEMGDASRIPEFIARAKDKSSGFRLMGFGHRVYKNFDPRAKVMKKACDDVLAELGIDDDPLLKIAKKLEQIALEDDYFVDKKLYPNVDFYSGIIMKAIGIPTEMFTVIFATGRTVGWIAHWNEMISNSYKIGRPRQLYTGAQRRAIVPLADRG